MESGVSSPMRGRTANQFAILEDEEGSAGAENGGKESEEGGTVETTAGSGRVGFRDDGQETMEFKAPRTKNKGSKKSRPMTIEEAGRRNREINEKIAEALKNPPPMDKEMREAMDQLEKKAKEASGKDETESKNTEAERTQMLGTRATTTPEVSKDGRTEDRRKSLNEMYRQSENASGYRENFFKKVTTIRMEIVGQKEEEVDTSSTVKTVRDSGKLYGEQTMQQCSDQQ
jgi:hypothetical protein